MDSWLLVGGRAGLFCSMFYSFCVTEKGRTRNFGIHVHVVHCICFYDKVLKHDLYISAVKIQLGHFETNSYASNWMIGE